MARARRRTRSNGKETSKKKNTTGGIPFFLTLGCLLLLAFLNLQTLPLLWDSAAASNSIYGIAGLSIGLWVGYVFMHGRLNIFVHEFKHAVISGLAGNKATGLHIQRDSGLFTYQYSNANARYNALIALAPYSLPLFTVPAAILGWLFFSENHHEFAVAIGIGFGCDLYMNFREVHPRQTDITGITGGYKVGLLFIAAMNIVLLSYYLAWMFQGVFGLRVLMANLWDFGVHLYWYLQNR